MKKLQVPISVELIEQELATGHELRGIQARVTQGLPLGAKLVGASMTGFHEVMLDFEAEGDGSGGVLPIIVTRYDDGGALIVRERDRQIAAEWFNAAHDDEHDMGELAAAAICYAVRAVDADITGVDQAKVGFDDWWPFDQKFWKPSPDPIRDLVKAGALIAAEIDRRQRLAARRKQACG